MTTYKPIICRCCGKEVFSYFDNYPIHTRCIPKHWGDHKNGIKNGRCKEFPLRKGVAK